MPIMNPDQRSKEYNAGYNARIEHSQPSPATLKFMELIQNEITEIKNDIKEIKTNYPTCDKMNLVVITAMREATKEFWKEANDRFAPKWVQTVVAGMVGAVLLAFLGFLVELIKKGGM